MKILRKSVPKSDSQKCQNQLQRTQGFCVADFATLSDERTSCSKTFLLFNTAVRALRSKI